MWVDKHEKCNLIECLYLQNIKIIKKNTRLPTLLM